MSALLATVASASLPLARTSEGSKSGPIGLGIILLLCVACYFLFKSMSQHLKSVREDFPKDLPSPTGSRPAAVVVPRAVPLDEQEPASTSDPTVDRELHRSDG